MATGPIESAVVDAERVAKKQRTCAASTSNGLDSLLHMLQAAKKLLDNTSGDPSPSFLHDLYTQLNGTNVVATITSDTKELHSAVSKLGKNIDKAFVADVCKASRAVDFDRATLDTVVAQHLYQEGRFETGDVFVQEARVQGGDALKEPFVAMHGVLCEIRRRNLQPAMVWIEEHKHALQKHGVSDSFEFQLHRLQFLTILEHTGHLQAVQYARTHLCRFYSSHGAEVDRLMGCTLYRGRLHTSPYADLLSPALWDEFGLEFARQCCSLVGQSCHSPLLVSVAAGAVALPTLLKMASLITGKGMGADVEELPVELELGREFVFHSIFACPVSREQSSSDNPPTMLPCGHVLCRLSIMRLAKHSARTFKCPYCPAEASVSSCKQLYFPDME